MSGVASGSLTGIWQGLYTYPKSLRHVSFSATLMEAGASVTGSTHELCDHGVHKGQMLYALLDGQRAGSRLSFNKTYEGGLEGFGVVHYEGTISADLTEIEGRWRTSPAWSGTFLMIRQSGRKQAVARKATARV